MKIFRHSQNKNEYIDVGLIFSTFVLLVIGLIMIYSTSAYEAGLINNDSLYYLKKQILAVVVGLGAFAFCSNVDHRYLKGKSMVAIIIAVISLFLLIPLGYSANGATRWFKIGPVSVQPAEIVKIAVIMFMADKLSGLLGSIKSLKVTGKLCILPAILAGVILIFTSNLSSAIIVCGITFVMLYAVTPSAKRFVIVIIIVVGVAALYVISVKNKSTTGFQHDYRGDRVMAWLDPEQYASDEGYQTLQSLYAIGSGGFWGKGLGESVQKLGYIPEAQNDMIFAIICEELGLVGAFFVMLLFLVLIMRCMYIAIHTEDFFGKLLVIGVMAHISIQVILNIAVVTNTIPNTGISLPFISYGGTSLAFLMAEIGIVVSVGKNLNA